MAVIVIIKKDKLNYGTKRYVSHAYGIVHNLTFAHKKKQIRQRYRNIDFHPKIRYYREKLDLIDKTEKSIDEEITNMFNKCIGWTPVCLY